MILGFCTFLRCRRVVVLTPLPCFMFRTSARVIYGCDCKGRDALLFCFRYLFVLLLEFLDDELRIMGV